MDAGFTYAHFFCEVSIAEAVKSDGPSGVLGRIQQCGFCISLHLPFSKYLDLELLIRFLQLLRHLQDSNQIAVQLLYPQVAIFHPKDHFIEWGIS